MSTAFWVIIAILSGVIVYAVIIFNGLVSFRNRVKNSFSQINVQLQRRHELIPNLVESAKAYMAHEKET
ncbi:MAG: LemA family protein, partial [Gammaproteobacteria bacterium]|nr:LemA family protein [Gammaproteobacteria bacterium]